ncbi:MAG: hypothetical protein ACK2U2_13275 [Anaerolineae bacterium]
MATSLTIYEPFPQWAGLELVELLRAFGTIPAGLSLTGSRRGAILVLTTRC